MKERVDALVGAALRGDVGDDVPLRLRAHPAPGGQAARLLLTSFSIYDQADSQRLMALVCRELDLDPKRYPPRSFSAQVSNLKNELIDYETASARASTHLERDARRGLPQLPAAARPGRRDGLRRPDHDDGQAVPALPRRRRALPAPVPARLVDEYQDTNHAQYMLVRELAGRPEVRTVDGDLVREGGVAPAELCVVGDADQSIYAFRGATIRNILEFERDYPDARTILLEQNYRSTQTILSAANAVISRNASRKPKNLWSDQGGGRARSSATSPTTSTTRPRSSPRRSTGSPTTRASRPATSRCSTGPTPRPGCSRRSSSGSACRTRSSAGCGSTSARRSATCSPTCACWPTRGHGVAAPHPQRAQARHRRPRRGDGRGARRPGAHLVLGGAAPGRRGAGHGHPVAQRDQGVRRADGRAATGQGRSLPPSTLAAGGADRHRLPGRAAGLGRPAGREPRWRTSTS